jgi:hypothetical protein
MTLESSHTQLIPMEYQTRARPVTLSLQNATHVLVKPELSTASREAVIGTLD